MFNLFVVSVFWSFMTDLYRPEQSKRLFGLVAVGGTLGALLGAVITSTLVELLGPINLMLVSALCLEWAVQACRALDRREAALARPAGDKGAEAGNRVLIGGSMFEGVSQLARSPYLLGIAGLMLLYTIAATFLYFQRIDIAARVFADDAPARIQLFAAMDVATNVLTLLTQTLLTGRLLRRLGVGFGLAFLPLLSLIGFGVLGFAPVLSVVVVFEVFRRAGNYALARPAREVLYTVLERGDKYKAKNLNDTFVYRLGDQVGSWSYTLMAWLGLSLSGLAFSMVPAASLWLLLALWLARRYRVLQGTRE